MARSALVVSEEFYGWGQYWKVPGWAIRSLSMQSNGVPTLEALEDVDLVVVIGQIERAQRSAQLAGQLRLAVERGVTAVCLYPVILKDPLRALVRDIAPELAKVNRRNSTSPVDWRAEAFYEYLGAFGRGGETLTGLSSHAEVLGKINGDPAAARISIGSGTFYLLPYQIASMQASYGSLLTTLLQAITDFEAGGQEDLPEFLEEFRLPREQELLDEISDREGELRSLRARADRLREYRQIVGQASGSDLEVLLIEILNIVLGETEYEAVDREDVKAEDFWITGPRGDFAVVEAKGIGGGVNRQAVNQVDNHRAEHDLGTDEIPGLLVVNAFRNSEELAQRELPVPPDVVKHAVRLNVVILRTLDLFYLLGQALDGKDAASALIAALQAEGGWLRASPSSVDLVTS